MNRMVWCVAVGILLSGCGSREATTDKAAVGIQARDYIQEGTTFLAKGDINMAMRTFQEGVIANPKDGKLRFVLAQAFMRAENYTNALENFKVVTDLEPDNGHAYLLLGGCYDSLGKRAEAIESIKKSVAIFQFKKDEENFKQAIAILGSLMNNSGAAQAQAE